MATISILLIFIIGYLAIAFEQVVQINKAASALITGVLCWTVYITQHTDEAFVSATLLHHIAEIASILFFLLGAMTIVELIDAHNGFDIISQKISTTSVSKFLLIITVISFFLSAFLDNLTTAIVMTTLCSKILSDKQHKLWFSGMIIMAANAGGAWSPLGDVTTTMLWIGGQITALNIIKQLFLPSLFACIVPALLIANIFKGKKFMPIAFVKQTAQSKKEGKVILIAGIGFLLFVPVFKSITHLPPFMGMLLALGFMWVITTIIHKKKQVDIAEKYSVATALQKIDTPSILFFLGILLAVGALQAIGVLKELSSFLTNTLHNDYAIGIALGLLSALVDNVPLVAATQGMFDLATYPTDHAFWEFLALTTGTGGSAIIIGSAAGVAVMGIENISFMWYLKKITWLALLGFFAGIFIFWLQTIM
jgi:Na+/H+ antiporter NhaD/arsenite permease-like protein